jgi:hypothetical protein
MGYYVRAFCISDNVPAISVIFEWLEQRGRHLELDKEMIAADEKSNKWEQVAVVYKKGKLPILAECNRGDGSPDCLMREEIGEFLEFVGSPGLSLARRKVINHLKKTKYIIACQLPTSDIDDDGYDANWDFLTYFVENCSGIIQADGEGFYEGNKLIVELK